MSYARVEFLEYIMMYYNIWRVELPNTYTTHHLTHGIYQLEFVKGLQVFRNSPHFTASDMESRKDEADVLYVQSILIY